MQIGFWERVIGFAFILFLIGCIVAYHYFTGRVAARKAARAAGKAPMAPGGPTAPTGSKGPKIMS